jgi:hypothetical protein
MSEAERSAAQNGAFRIVRLSRPVQAHGEMIRELRLREPTGADAFECGLPIEFAGERMTVGVPAMMQIASRLASVPLSTLKAMPLCDIMLLVGEISSFLAPPEASEAPALTAPSNEPSISHGSGGVIPQRSLHSV